MKPSEGMTLGEAIDESENRKMLFHEICPFRIGSRVAVAPTNQFAGEWRGKYIVTGIRWEYQIGEGTGINISIAHPDDIAGRYGDTDGWRVDDLIPAP
jgi:hypothetical protein